VLVASLFLVSVFGVFEYAILQGYPEDLARTIAMNTLVTLEIFHLLFIRNMNTKSLSWKGIRGTRALWASIATVAVGQAAITYVPLLQGVFKTQAVYFWDVVLIVGLGMFLFIVIEAEKQFRLRVLDKPF
jgi:magnesium-transporting ATPase (P-type)